MDINMKYSIAHSHAWATAVLISRLQIYTRACIDQATVSETELIVSSTVQGPAKNTIKIDMLLTDD